MRRIAFHIHKLGQGGAERVVTNLANEFADKGYEVYVATEEYEREGEQGFRLDPRVTRVHVGLRAGDERKGRIIKFLLRVRYLREFVQEYKPEVLIPFCRRENYRALMAARGVRVDYGTSRHETPVIVCCRTNPDDYMEHRPGESNLDPSMRHTDSHKGHYNERSDRIQIRLLYPGAAGAVFQTTGQMAFFHPWLRQKSAVILNPVNRKYVGVPAPEVRDKAVVHHARLVNFKNQEMLCRAFLKVHAAHPDYVLRIYGSASGDGTRGRLEELIRTNHAEEFIFLMGGSDELERQLPQGAVYAFTSDWEGMPNALIEAMALGLPCVATDCPCGGPRDLVEDGVNGLLVPVMDEDAVAAGISRLIEDPALAERLGRNARKTIEERCDADRIFQQWSAYIDEVIQRAGR